jgi:RNA polymerase sigma factor (sigma-70 family)
VSSAPVGDTLADALAAFWPVRRRLFGIAYRVLGSRMDAEDVVQDVWLRWQGCDRAAVRDPVAYLAAATTRRALTVLHSARVRHELPVGHWVPESAARNAGTADPNPSVADPERLAERTESLGAAIRLLLEKLSPRERAAYILREAFHYSFRDISRIVMIEEAAARQLLSRARVRLAGDRRRPTNIIEQRRLLTAFLAAARTGDMAELRSALGYCDAADYFDAADAGAAVVSQSAKWVSEMSAPGPGSSDRSVSV